MIPLPRTLLLLCMLLCTFSHSSHAQEKPAPLPKGVEAVWDLKKAYREQTPTQERICLNGLWLWQPAQSREENLPLGDWGYFKVPGPWPGISDYMQKDCQTVFQNPAWKQQNFAGLTAAWYEREMNIPANWIDHKVSLYAEYINSLAIVYVDGKKAGEIRFPSATVDISALCTPGKTHKLTLLVIAMPLKGVMLSYTDSASAREIKGAVARRGLCGDVFLTGTRKGPRIANVKISTSIRKDEVTIDAGIDSLPPESEYSLRIQVLDKSAVAANFKSARFKADDLRNGHIHLTEKLKPLKLWDIHTPQNQYDLIVSLIDSNSRELDKSLPLRFGFRELWIDGRDFYLNGSRIFLSAVPLDNAEVGAAWATYKAARESFERLKSFGINFVYSHNYGCEPGSHLSFTEILKAADDTGMLVALSQPHFSHYQWKGENADQTNGYAHHARFYSEVAGNHPSVVFYSMSHNATGYSEDMNPDMIDGIQDPRDTWSLNNSRLALRAEAIVNQIDPTRIVYHHASGNLGSMHPMNFYPNFVPIQELSDWFEHWSTTGVKPAFMCEYGAPFTWDWTMYRGWYKGEREFGSAKVPWEFCLAEWNAQFLGAQVYKISDSEKANLRWEAKQFEAGKTWHRWDYPVEVGSKRLEERYPVFAKYITENWRAFRAWEVSANSPWEYEHFWKARDGVKRDRMNLPVDWENLQRPGYSPDYIEKRYERMDLAFERTDWIATPAAEALIRNNKPLLGFIAGKPEAFTSKDHNFLPGQTVEKQIILINNSREAVEARCEWTFDFPERQSGTTNISIPTGEQSRVPIQFNVPPKTAAGAYSMKAVIHFSNGEQQEDSFTVNVLAPTEENVQLASRIALFDPIGETADWLKTKGIKFDVVQPTTTMDSYDLLIVGKAALNLTNQVPDISAVRNGLKIVFFEQTPDALEKRLGFRVAAYGLRQVFSTIPNHPILKGIHADHLHDWIGSATLLPPRLTYEMRPRYGPTIQWCGIPVTQIWRCGNRGNIASALIEKPETGNFLPILSGGYSLQYSPLLLCPEGKGLLVFCQLDVTARTEADPAADKIAANLLQYVADWKPTPPRQIFYAGDAEGNDYLTTLGFTVAPFTGQPLTQETILIVAPKGTESLSRFKAQIAEWLHSGGHLLAIGLSAAEANRFLPLNLSTTQSEHISSYFDSPGMDSPFAAISPPDLHNRAPRDFPLVTDGANVLGDGVLAWADGLNILFCQIVPWEFKDVGKPNIKKTRRHLAFLTSRLLSNMGAQSENLLVGRFSAPPRDHEKRFAHGLYLDQPEEWDYPYRFFRW
jgi:beta-galactosidase